MIRETYSVEIDYDDGTRIDKPRAYSDAIGVALHRGLVSLGYATGDIRVVSVARDDLQQRANEIADADKAQDANQGVA